MKFRVLLLLLLASSLYADVKVQDGRVSADLQSQPLSQVLEHLRTQTKMRLVIDDSISGQIVSAHFQDLPVGLALKKILEGTSINYAVMGGPNGEPESVFIGTSARPGAPPRRLDNRPTGNRGVVSPIPPPPSPPIPQPDARQPEPQPNRPPTPGVNIPTGGGFVPEQPQLDQPEQQQPQEQLDDNNSED